MSTTRRDLFRLLLGALGCQPGWANSGAAGEQLRQYRADAVVTLLSIPIVTKRGVGSGYASLRQEGSGSDRRLCLRFAAGSWPKEAHGLNRLGYIEEVVEERGEQPCRAGYFGFMTSSDEHSVDEARKALNSNGVEAVPYSTILGQSEPGTYFATKTRFQSEEGYTWSDWSELLPKARRAVDSNDATVLANERRPDDGSVASPFLYSLWRAITAPASDQELRYAWGECDYALEVEKKPDSSMGSKLAKRSLTQHPSRVVRLVGKARNLKSGKQSKFRFWYEEGAYSLLPLRIEYRPRSFLHLIFEADPAITLTPPPEQASRLRSAPARPALRGDD